MKEFLINKLGREQGERLWELISKRLLYLKNTAEYSSRKREKLLKNLILPRIAMYQILCEEGFSKENALSLMDEHMVIYNAIPMKEKYQLLDKLPFAYDIFRLGFTRVVSTSDLWDAEIKRGKNHFSVTISKCFWYDTFQKYGCEELCQFACKCDKITYGSLNHIGFSRSQTIGTGGLCCDFKFKKL